MLGDDQYALNVHNVHRRTNKRSSNSCGQKHAYIVIIGLAEPSRGLYAKSSEPPERSMMLGLQAAEPFSFFTAALLAGVSALTAAAQQQHKPFRRSASMTCVA